MQRGLFDKFDDEGGTPTYRLRWVTEIKLTTDETRRGEFIRFLIERGKLSEWCEPPRN